MACWIGPAKMNDCWAFCLGDCSDKMSREHIISAAMFLSDTIVVQGLPWCRDERKEIGLSSFTKKILCTKHNSDLSVYDTAAKESIETLRESTRLSNLRMEGKRKHTRIVHFPIDGVALERWFLKTFYQRRL